MPRRPRRSADRSAGLLRRLRGRDADTCEITRGSRPRCVAATARAGARRTRHDDRGRVRAGHLHAVRLVVLRLALGLAAGDRGLGLARRRSSSPASTRARHAARRARPADDHRGVHAAAGDRRARERRAARAAPRRRSRPRCSSRRWWAASGSSKASASCFGGVRLKAQLVDPSRADGDGRMLLDGLFPRWRAGRGVRVRPQRHPALVGGAEDPQGARTQELDATRAAPRGARTACARCRCSRRWRVGARPVRLRVRRARRRGRRAACRSSLIVGSGSRDLRRDRDGRRASR